MPDFSFDLTRQCCDADAYLGLGYRCAMAGDCYDELRPLGDALWFSLPYRLGTGPDLLLWIQVGLLGVIAYTLFRLLRGALPWRLLRLAAALAFLGWQLRPTFFNPLADTPASLLLIEGILLAILAQRQLQPWLFLIAGLLLGGSCLLRAAYFHPLCAAGLLFFAATALQYRARLAAAPHLLLLSYLLPLAFQFHATWQHEREWSFLSSSQTRGQLSDHLKSAVVGYDTLLIESSHYWAPACQPSRGVFTGLREQQYQQVACLLSQRIYFYFGSYAAHTFYGDDSKNFVSNSFAEDIGNLTAWSFQHAEAAARTARSPLDDLHASTVTLYAAATPAWIETGSTLPLPAGHYLASFWLWADATYPPITLEFSTLQKTLSPLTGEWVMKPLNQRSVILTASPQQFWLEFEQPSTGFVALRVGSAQVANDLHFFTWGAMLESANTRTGYQRSQTPLFGKMGDDSTISKHERFFSPVLLFFNLLVIALGFFTLVGQRTENGPALTLFVATLLTFILLEALLILPEQRFIQAALSLLGILACLSLNPGPRNPEAHHAAD